MRADYVIIGAGSSGCTTALRLAEAGKSVIIIEYGGTDAGPLIQMPAALSYPMNMSRYDWGYSSEPEPHLNNRCLVTPRGKVIGGSSSINGMVYVRGHAKDFDHWAESGATGWNYADVLPYFRRMEHWHDGGHGGNPEWRGDSGPLHISRGKRENPLFHAFVDAGKQAGYETTEDYNGEKQEGFGAMEQTVWQGRRWSTANAYLRPALKYPHCTLVRGLAQKILFEGKKAVGVQIATKSGLQNIHADGEVILAASSINSPKLLMLSGIGNAEHLKEHGITPLVHREGVGQNLQDHLELYIQMAASQPISLYKHWNIFSKAMIGARWLLTKTGLGASNHFESAAFIRPRAGVEYPDIQYHFLPIAVRYDGQTAAEGHGFQAHVGPMRSSSKGRITLNSADPKAAPKIQFNYMSQQQDWIDFRQCIHLTREIFAQEAFRPYVKSKIQPGSAIQSDSALNDFIREHVESAYHPCGTNRMGDAHDPQSVVDPKGRVIGVKSLRIVDCSVFPRITNGNLNGPGIMVAEKISDHILGRTPLPTASNKPWLHPNWQSQQR